MPRTKYVEICEDLKKKIERNFYQYQQFLPSENTQAQKYSKNRPITPAYPVISDTVKKLFEDVGINKRDVKVSVTEAVEKINNSLKNTPKQ